MEFIKIRMLFSFLSIQFIFSVDYILLFCIVYLFFLGIFVQFFKNYRKFKKYNNMLQFKVIVKLYSLNQNFYSNQGEKEKFKQRNLEKFSEINGIEI